MLNPQTTYNTSTLKAAILILNEPFLTTIQPSDQSENLKKGIASLQNLTHHTPDIMAFSKHI